MTTVLPIAFLTLNGPFVCALSREESIAGAVVLAAPFYSDNGKAAGSVGVHGLSVKDDPKIEQLGKMLSQEGDRLSRALVSKGHMSRWPLFMDLQTYYRTQPHTNESAPKNSKV
ncbi:IclR family transcriptional regulator [Noviherbaspirillum pedocola]|uniref:IclR-ED domain-containing protein n=1 Tax=Noviherbaspirillum pedocola TaxID=2801341 RepID=A0A934SRQ3_9BURK|nr:hypothetical protein [Noviherbaspirillum pedocola]MBK4735526.1 hypothetical protein [Noviherbaspirillum pedocola]